MAKQKDAPVIVMPDSDPARTIEINKLTADLKGELIYAPFSMLRANFSRNVRLSQGSEITGGFKFNKDTYDFPGMIADLERGGAVREPLVVSAKIDVITGDEYYEVLRGFRRFGAMERIINQGTNKSLIESFQKIPLLVLRGLDRKSEDALINDQTSKQFLRCEVLREVWRRLKDGWAWYDIGVSMAEQLAQTYGEYKRLSEFKKAATDEERTKIIKSWLNNTLNQYWQGVYLHGGPQVRKWLFLTLAEEDGILSASDEKAKVRMTSGKWNQLYSAIKADHSAGAWDSENGTGPAFEETVTKLTAPKGPKGPGSEYRAKDGAEIFAQSNVEGRSAPLRDAMRFCLQGSHVSLNDWDTLFNSYLAKKDVISRAAGHLPDSVREILLKAFDPSATADDFQGLIARIAVEHLKESQETVTLPETTEGSEPITNKRSKAKK